ncbi:hypothetical protein AWC17_15285 [Mycobacterium nebraskense]|jgi:hypothetical protein|uniref:Uncharacterized protein n=1 Tax=Mycobacterium nebraskense TaxID=244292 RepID=A0A1X1YYQ7_9MYCO|nr:hypothetical protein AWC17_15285 [Mycobacterium nebraskense]
MLIGGLVCSFVIGLGYAAWEDTAAGRRYGRHVRLVFSVVTLAGGIVMVAALAVMVSCLVLGYGRAPLAGSGFGQEVARMAADGVAAAVSLMMISCIRRFRRYVRATNVGANVAGRVNN